MRTSTKGAAVKPAGSAGERELLDVHEVASLMGVHRNTVRRLYGSGGLPIVHIGRVIRFRRSDVDAWLAAQVETKPARA